MEKSRYFLGALALLAGVPPAVAQAQEFKREVWLNPGLLSYHFDRSKHYRDFNYGAGAEMILSPDHALLAGIYENSESETSRYLGYQWRPLHWQPSGLRVSAGIAVSLIDGYPSESNGGWFVAPLPTVSVEGEKFGANFVLIPNVHNGAAVAVQLKMKVW